MKVLLTSSLQWTGDACNIIKDRNPDVEVMVNLEQLLALIKEGKVERVCVLWGGVCFDGHESAEKIHQVDPEIPVLVWDSLDLPTQTRPNETYLNVKDFDPADLWRTFDEFFGVLTL